MIPSAFRNRRALAATLGGMLAALRLAAASAAPASATDDVLLFTYFRDNGQAGVFLAESTDGRTFTPLNGDRPIFTPPKWAGQGLTRDASILYRDGVFRMVWTSQWRGRVFGYAESRDLVTWSEPRQIRPFPAALPDLDQPENIWAPEIHWDPFKRDFFVLFSSTTPRERTDGDRSDNKGDNTSPYDNRIFITRTPDGREFSPARLFFDQDFSGIDAVLHIDVPGDRWVMVVKCSRDPHVSPLPGRNLRLTFTGPDLDHPAFTPVSAPIAGTHSSMFRHPDPIKSMAEGQSLIRHRDLWWLYWEEPAGHGMQLGTSPDLQTWTHVRDFSFPAGGHHGTAFFAPRAAVGWLRAPTPRTTAAPAPAPGALLPGGADAWALAWSEEFDRPDTELEQKWISQNSASTHILSSRWRENAVVSDGSLKLINRKETRGGNAWTSGNIWTRETFQYGYFECRYRYAAAEATNNSFWLMPTTKGPVPKGKFFEIDINEGHYPNQVATNVHNHSDTTVVNGRRTHPSSSKSYAFGVRPDVTIQLELPIQTRRIRFTSTHGVHFHLGEFRIYNLNPAGYPDALSPTADQDRPGLVNFARDPSTQLATSGFYQSGPDTSRRLVDGRIDTSWISQRDGEKWVEFAFPEERTVGCVQFLNGWRENGTWKAMVDNYRVAYHDGQKWVEMAAFDLRDGAYNFARDYQVFGLDWSERELVFYLNGRELRREKNEFAHSPASIWLSLAIISWSGRVTDAIHGTQMEVDYVRVYRRKP